MHPAPQRQTWPAGSFPPGIRAKPLWPLALLACHSPTTASAQSAFQESAGSGWFGTLLACSLLAIIAAVFWNRRHAHEKRERRRLEQRLADLTGHLSDGLFEARAFPSGEVRLLFSNKATRDLLRIDNSEVAVKLDDQIFSSYLHPDDDARIRQSIKRSIESLEPIEEDFRYLQANGQYRQLRADIAVRVMDDGGVIWTGALHDLNHENTLRDQIHHLTISKDLFFAAASHELRTPVHSIGLALEQLSLADGTQDAGALSSALEASERLRALLNDLLELARVQPEELILKPADFSLSRLLEGLTHEFRDAFARKSISFKVAIEQGVPDSLTADHRRLHQVLANLIINALRFSHGGEVTISVTAPDESTDARSLPATVNLRFAVSDHGEGIAPDQQERVFEPFVSSHVIASDALALRAYNQPDSSPVTTGTGLGLAICRRIVSRMGGRIWLDSVLGRGTVARFEIPVDRAIGDSGGPERARSVASATSPAPAGLPTRAQTRKRRNVLLVDDDRLGRTLMATLLADEGYLVTQAGSGDEALTKYRQGGFDAVVTDLRMPGMDGETLAARIRSLSESVAESGQTQRHALPSRNMGLTPRPRLIALTASLGGVDASHRADEVFDKRLQKPVGVDQLVSALET